MHCTIRYRLILFEIRTGPVAIWRSGDIVLTLWLMLCTTIIQYHVTGLCSSENNTRRQCTLQPPPKEINIAQKTCSFLRILIDEKQFYGFWLALTSDCDSSCCFNGMHNSYLCCSCICRGKLNDNYTKATINTRKKPLSNFVILVLLLFLR